MKGNMFVGIKCYSAAYARMRMQIVLKQSIRTICVQHKLTHANTTHKSIATTRRILF